MVQSGKGRPPDSEEMSEWQFWLGNQVEGYAEAYFNKGIAQGSGGDIQRAIEEFREALRLEPHLAGAYYSRGNMRVDVGDIDGALRDFDAAI